MDHDHPDKELFSQPELVADLLRLADMADGRELGSLDRMRRDRLQYLITRGDGA